MKYAESILDVGRLPLRRRDRAAMQYALEMLRASDEPAYVAFDRAMNALEEHGSAGPCRDIWCAMWRTLQGMFAEDRRLHIRPLRARLALLLRCLLRVDAGDYGPSGYVDVDDDDSPVWAWEDVWPANRDIRLQPRPIRPLWQDAPRSQR